MGQSGSKQYNVLEPAQDTMKRQQSKKIAKLKQIQTKKVQMEAQINKLHANVAATEPMLLKLNANVQRLETGIQELSKY